MSKHYPAVSTFSKGPSQWSANAPKTIQSGEGGRVFADGKWYVDWTMGLAAVSLGYHNFETSVAVMSRAIAGAVFGLPHRLEEEYADALTAVLPWGDDSAVRFGKNGSDATEGAIRAARHITGRDNIISLGYHGWLTTCPNKNGIPQSTRDLVTETWDTANDPAACLIVEPEGHSDMDLYAMRLWCNETGTLLIFDEILTGFRTPSYWYGTYRGIKPDMLTAGKAIANGYPLSFIAGRSDLMQVFAGDVGMSFTYAGDTMGLAAGLATLRKYQREPVIEKLWETGSKIKAAWGKDIPLLGQPSRLVVKYPSLAHRTLFSQEMVKRGVLWSVGATPCYAHTEEDIAQTVSAIKDSLQVLKSVEDPATLVEGPVVAMPYRQMVVAA